MTKRKKRKAVLTARMTLHCTKDEKDVIVWAAKALNITVSQFVRDALEIAAARIVYQGKS